MSSTIVGRVRAIFKLPAYFGNYPHPLAYVDLFTGNFYTRAANSRFYQVRRAMVQDPQKSAVVRLDSILGSCHLTPRTDGLEMDASWTMDNVLNKADGFYLNHYISPYMFLRLRPE
jgi:hypothetical protein